MVLFFNKSNAVIKIFNDLGFPYNLLKLTLIIPSFLRDSIYVGVPAKSIGKRS